MDVGEYKFIEVNEKGRVVRIPLAPLPESQDDADGVLLPSWMIHIEGAGTKSNVAGSVDDVGKSLGEYTYLYGWFGDSKREVRGGAGVNLITSGVIWYSVLYTIVPNGEHSAFVRNAVHSGAIIPLINIVRLSRINTTAAVIQSLTFKTCHPYSYQAMLDFTVFSFTFCLRDNLVAGYKQDGTPEGQNVCHIDLSQNTVG
jgi:hypothetical protein